MNIETIKNLNKLKNASLVNHELVYLNSNKLTKILLELLYKEGFILSYKIKEKNNEQKTTNFLVKIRYLYNKPVFKHLKIVSSPSHRKFLCLKNISKITSKKNLFVFSTSKGILTLNQCKRFKVGGLLLFIC
jgi:small subunit ribosomal protein S8